MFAQHEDRVAHLQVLRANRGHVGDAQHEADGVQDVGLATAVEASDGVEAFVPSRDHGAHRVRLEALLLWSVSAQRPEAESKQQTGVAEGVIRR